MKQLTLKAFDDTEIGIDLWDEVENPIGVIQIAHGMAEHPDRYDDFAKYLNAKGYIVAADDHRGHRRGAINGENGMTYGDSWNQTLEDMNTLLDYLKETYKLEVVLVGHSYGSFLSQRFIELHSDKLAGCILSGTAYMKGILIRMGKMIASLQALFLGEEKKGKLIDKLSFGAYNKPFVEQGQQFAWLSRDKEQVAKYEADENCGYVLCIGYYLSFFRGVLKTYGKDAETIRKDFPLMIAVGSDDPVSNKAALATKLNDFYLGLGLKPEYKVYPGARHEILNETNNAEVYDDFGKFIDTIFAEK
ncbi:MAG: alpha/beta hydrolase [Clostridia bacterium]|nr:alpha/beta hydrolase [Clostridia bacterium]